MLRLKSLGQTVIEFDDARVTPAAETVFATGLYLAMEAGRPVGRDELSQMIWPGVPEDKAQHGLRQAIYRLRSFGATIKADRDSLTLPAKYCSVDFAPLLTGASSASNLEELVEGIGGSFLPGYRPQLSDEFSAWVERKRDIVHSALLRALVATLETKKGRSDWTAAENIAKLCLTIDPLNEEATLTIAEAAVLGGSKSKAMSILNAYLEDIGPAAGEIRLPAVMLRRRISETSPDLTAILHDVPFVGRDREMSELLSALSRAMSGKGGTLIISGEPGIGKSRLLAEFRRVASLRAVKFASVGSQSHDKRRPLSVFIDLIPQLLRLPGALGCSPESMSYLKRLTNHDPAAFEEEEFPERPEIRYENAKHALIDVITAIASETCVILTLEDGHWLDDLSDRMVEELANLFRSKNILFLISARNSALANENTVSMVLSSLAHAACYATVQAANDRLKEQADFVEWCVASSGGNPYYLIELARNGTNTLAGFRPPTSLTRLLQDRVACLPSEARSLLEVCCVLGKLSTIVRVEASIMQSRLELISSLSELEKRGMIDIDGDKLSSRHDLLTSAVLSLMPRSTRLTLHRFVATALEVEAAETKATNLLWASAEHWAAAEDAQKAILLFRSCGRHLLNITMPNEAVLVYQRADALATSPKEKYEIGADHAKALIGADRIAEAYTCLTTLNTMRCLITPTPSLVDDVGMMFLQVSWSLGKDVDELFNRCVDRLAIGDGNVKEKIRAIQWLLTEADNLCNFSLGNRLYQQVIDPEMISEMATDVRLHIEMVYQCAFGSGKRAKETARLLLEFVRRERFGMFTCRYLRHIAHVYRCHGTCAETVSLLDEASHIASELNSTFALATCASSRASILMQTGDLDSAKLWLTRAVELNPPSGANVLDTNLMSLLAELAIYSGDAEEASRMIENCAPAVGRSARTVARTYALKIRVRMLRREPIDDEMLGNLISAFEITSHSTIQDYHASTLINAFLYTGRVADARNLAENYIESSRRDLSPLSYDLVKAVEACGDGKNKTC